MTVQPGTGLDRNSVAAALEGAKIQTRMLFAGNLVRQPCFDELRSRAEGYRAGG